MGPAWAPAQWLLQRDVTHRLYYGHVSRVMHSMQLAAFCASTCALGAHSPLAPLPANGDVHRIVAWHLGGRGVGDTRRDDQGRHPLAKCASDEPGVSEGAGERVSDEEVARLQEIWQATALERTATRITRPRCVALLSRFRRQLVEAGATRAAVCLDEVHSPHPPLIYPRCTPPTLLSSVCVCVSCHPGEGDGHVPGVKQ